MSIHAIRLHFFIYVLCGIVINQIPTESQALQRQHNSVLIETIYGTMLIEDEAVLDILSSKAMLRLKKIHQYGIWNMLKKQEISYTRYDHSIGVYHLLVKFGAPREECIFGLIHDISHTVFSHVADYINGTITKHKSYQDDILKWYVYETDLKEILDRHGLLKILTDEKQQKFTMLKNYLPNLCVDRLEYNLYGGLIDNILSQPEIKNIICSLSWNNNNFIFTDPECAKKFAITSIKLSVHNWCDPTNSFIYQETATMLSYALEKNIINSNDFHFSDDETVWHILYSTDDPHIQKHIHHLKQHLLYFYPSSESNYDLAIETKFRGVDPLVQTATGEIKKLSEVDAEFAEYFTHAKTHCTKCSYIKKIAYSNM